MKQLTLMVLVMLCCMNSIIITYSADNKILRLSFTQEEIGDRFEVYCAHDPMYTILPERGGESQQMAKMIFFLPMTTCSKHVRAEIIALKNQQHDGYSVDCSPVKKPVAGVALTIHYDTSKIGVRILAFDPLDTKKGLSVLLYNKERMMRFVQKTDKVLHYAHCVTFYPKISHFNELNIV